MNNRRLFCFRPLAAHAEGHLEVTTIVVVVIDIYLYYYYYLTGYSEIIYGPRVVRDLLRGCIQVWVGAHPGFVGVSPCPGHPCFALRGAYRLFAALQVVGGDVLGQSGAARPARGAQEVTRVCKG